MKQVKLAEAITGNPGKALFFGFFSFFGRGKNEELPPRGRYFQNCRVTKSVIT